MVMVSPRLNPQASWEFMAEILVLHHPTTISPRYQAMGETHTHSCLMSDYMSLLLLSFLFLPLRSALWQHQADSHYPDHEQRLSTNRGQGIGPLPLHQDPRVPPHRPETGVQRGTHQGCGHHHQGQGLERLMKGL